MFVCLVCLVLTALTVEASVVFGGPGLYNNYHGEYAASYDNYVPRPYAFEYGVSDPHTGDHKTQWETKDQAGVVRGSYSLLEPDGTTRIVDYIADDHGFRAIVKKIGLHGQSVESHGGAVEGAGLVQPIVVPDIEPVPLHLEQPVQIAQPLPVVQQIQVQQPVVQQQVHVQQPVLQQQVQVEQEPIWQSYDGSAQHYQNLIQPQQSYPIQYPKAQGIYLEEPRQEIGYTQSYAPQNAQVEGPRKEIYLEQPPVAVPNAGLYYSQQTEVGNPQGKSVLTFHQPQQVVVPQERIAIPQDAVSTQNQYQLPVQNYQLEQGYPTPNQVLLQNQGQGYGDLRVEGISNVPQQGVLLPYGESSQSQGYQGITGNLEDDSEYTNYDQGGGGQLGFNQGEYLASPVKYGGALPLDWVPAHK